MSEEKTGATVENTQQGAGDGKNTQGNAAATQQGAKGGDEKKPAARKPASGGTAKKPAAKKETAKKQTTGKGDGTIGDGTAAPEKGNATLKKIGRDALKRNPSMRTVYVTADGTAFGTSNDAENHAKTLGDKGVEVVTE